MEQLQAEQAGSQQLHHQPEPDAVTRGGEAAQRQRHFCGQPESAGGPESNTDR